MDMMMSQKEAKRGQVMELLLAGKVDQKEAGKMLAVSVRQIKRILRRYRTLGLPGLISKKRGRVSNRRGHDHIVAHGLPVALYSDKHSIFRINAKGAAPESGTQFGRATRELGIECIHANSPQAKRRVERANQTLQDRLPKEMRLAGISDIAGANNWLPGFVASFNRRFAVIPKDAVDAHIAYPGSADELTNILSVQIAKTLSKNLSFQHECNLIQAKISGTGLVMRGAKVTLHDHFDGTRVLRWRNRKYTYTTLTKAQRKTAEADGKTINARVEEAIVKRCTTDIKRQKPAAGHPWRKMHVGKSAPDSKTVIQ
ncbi:hypothetical protein W01_25290 [Candidatus Nitrotoga sp. AM1P]|nr:hypothetical protein W01_25290 [Candidatus Nitrotoga sp. AM1P]